MDNTGGAMTLRAGDVLQIPLVDRGDGRTIRVHALVVDVVRQAGGEPVYCLRDRQGPVICLRAARLAWLRQRLGADAAAARRASRGSAPRGRGMTPTRSRAGGRARARRGGGGAAPTASRPPAARSPPEYGQRARSVLTERGYPVLPLWGQFLDHAERVQGPLAATFQVRVGRATTI